MAKEPPLKMKLAMPVSLSPTLSQREREQTIRCVSFTLSRVSCNQKGVKM